MRTKAVLKVLATVLVSAVLMGNFTVRLSGYATATSTTPSTAPPRPPRRSPTSIGPACATPSATAAHASAPTPWACARRSPSGRRGPSRPPSTGSPCSATRSPSARASRRRRPSAASSRPGWAAACPAARSGSSTSASPATRSRRCPRRSGACAGGRAGPRPARDHLQRLRAGALWPRRPLGLPAQPQAQLVPRAGRAPLPAAAPVPPHLLGATSPIDSASPDGSREREPRPPKASCRS